MPIIKTLTKATKLEKEKFTIPKVRTGRNPHPAHLSRMGFFRKGAGSPKPSPLPISITALPERRIRPRCFWTIQSSSTRWTPEPPPRYHQQPAINKAEFESSLLLPMKEDGLDHFRKEYNEMLLSRSPAPTTAWYRTVTSPLQ